MIKFENVSFKYLEEAGNKTINNINLHIRKGEVILFSGASGSGKSTIIRLINGLIPYYYQGELEGNVIINNKDICNYQLYDIAKLVGTVFQNPRTQFFNVDTTSELAFGCENLGMSEDEINKRINKTVNELKIEHLLNRSIFNLSGGEKQKIACASVFVSDPPVIVLDEPSANLDADAIEDLKRIIKIWKSKGKTIVIAEHRISYLWKLVDRVVLMKSGEIISNLNRSEFAKLSQKELRDASLRTLVEEKPKDIKMKSTNGNIKINNFKFSYNTEKNIINILNMKLPEKEITAIVGNNGSGKSTFLHCLCGLEKKCKGTLDYQGKIYTRNKRLKLVYMVMQDVNHQLFTESVLDEVLISMTNPDENQAKEILRSLDLLEFSDRHPASLSGGQKQRVAIATALASNREILLFDEPTSGLDYSHMIQVANLLKNLKLMGRTVFVVTHDTELIRECCTSVISL